MSAAHDDRGWRGVLDEPERTLFDAAQEADMLAPETIEARFVRFHREHPEVYDKLRDLALDLVHRGRTHLGIGMLWETLRYFTMLGAEPGEAEPFRLNDHFRSRYVRLLIDQEPELAEVFEVRALRSASRPPSARRLAGECSACAAGHCRSCSGTDCPHPCDVRVLL